MNKHHALSTARALSAAVTDSSLTYGLVQLHGRRDSVPEFRWLREGGKVEGVYEVSRPGENSLYLTVARHKKEARKYVISVYIGQKSNSNLELTNITPENDAVLWKYRPSKHDGRNPERKERFQNVIGGLEFEIPLPRLGEPGSVQAFLDSITELIELRSAVDELADGIAVAKSEFPEGKRVERLHRARERSAALIKAAKRRRLKLAGELRCDVCQFSFSDKYGELGKDYIEAHHTVPVSALGEAGVTRVEDMAMVCSNCHRMLHRRRPWLTMDQLTDLLSGESGGS